MDVGERAVPARAVAGTVDRHLLDRSRGPTADAEIRATGAQLIAERGRLDAALDKTLRETAEQSGRAPAEIVTLTLSELREHFAPKDRRAAEADLRRALDRLHGNGTAA